MATKLLVYGSDGDASITQNRTHRRWLADPGTTAANRKKQQPMIRRRHKPMRRGHPALSLPGFLPRDAERGPTFSKPNARAPCRGCRVESERSRAALKFFTLSSSKQYRHIACGTKQKILVRTCCTTLHIVNLSTHIRGTAKIRN
jgi:hypothetical protein